MTKEWQERCERICHGWITFKCMLYGSLIIFECGRIDSNKMLIHLVWKCVFLENEMH